MLKVTTLAVAALLSLSPALAETPVATDTMTKAQVRERLAACGAKWQQMKRNGTDGSQIWREFSKTCMAASTSGPNGADKARAAPPKNENASPIR